jgi:hypothetical protein
MTAREFDAHERRWKRVIKFAVAALLLDLACLLLAWPAPGAKFLCVMVAIASVGALLVAAIRLQRTNTRERRAAADIDTDDLPLPDLADIVPDFDFDD